MNEPSDNNSTPDAIQRKPAGGRSQPLTVCSSFNHELMFDNPSREKSDDESLGNHWSVPWADLMMVMFVLFASLLTAQLMQEQQQLEPEQIEKEIETADL